MSDMGVIKLKPRHQYKRKNCPAARRQQAIRGFQALVAMAVRAYTDQELDELLSPQPYSVRYRVLQAAGPHLSFEPSQKIMRKLLGPPTPGDITPEIQMQLEVALDLVKPLR